MQTITRVQVAILLLLVSFAPVCSMIISPALPALSRHLRIFASDAQLLITTYLLGFAIGQLFYGPLSNRFGRKPFIFIGIVTSGITSLLGLLSATYQLFPLLLTSRIFMGLAGGACLKMSYNLAADLLSEGHLTTMISLFVLAFATIPPMGVAFSGFLTQYFGWQSVFLFLFAYSAIILYLSLTLPETISEKDPTALRTAHILHGLKGTLKNQRLLLSSLLMGCSSSVTYLFATIAPFISMEILNIKPNIYGLLAMLANTGMLGAGLLGIHLSKTHTRLYVVFLGSALYIFGATLLFIPSYLSAVTPLSLFLPMPLIFLGSNLAFTNASSIGLSSAQDKSYASSMMSFINLTFTMLITFLACRYPSSNTHVMPTILISLSLFTLALWARLRHLSSQPSNYTKR